MPWNRIPSTQVFLQASMFPGGGDRALSSHTNSRARLSKGPRRTEFAPRKDAEPTSDRVFAHFLAVSASQCHRLSPTPHSWVICPGTSGPRFRAPIFQHISWGSFVALAPPPLEYPTSRPRHVFYFFRHAPRILLFPYCLCSLELSIWLRGIVTLRAKQSPALEHLAGVPMSLLNRVLDKSVARDYEEVRHMACEAALLLLDPAKEAPIRRWANDPRVAGAGEVADGRGVPSARGVPVGWRSLRSHSRSDSGSRGAPNERASDSRAAPERRARGAEPGAHL